MTTPHRVRDAGRGAVRPGRARRGQAGTVRVLVPALATITVLLLAAVVGLGLLARRSLADQQAELVALRAQQQADLRQSDAAQAGAAPELDLAALRAQLDAVRAADRSVDTSVETWRKGGSQLRIVWEAVGRCMALVDAYNQAVTPFSAEQLGGLPVKVDLTAGATDCGAATLAKNAKGAGF